MIKLRKPNYSKGPGDLFVIIPTILLQKMDWRTVMDNEGGLKNATISYTLHFRWIKMQFSIGFDYKKQR